MLSEDNGDEHCFQQRETRILCARPADNLLCTLPIWLPDWVAWYASRRNHSVKYVRDATPYDLMTSRSRASQPVRTASWSPRKIARGSPKQKYISTTSVAAPLWEDATLQEAQIESYVQDDAPTLQLLVRPNQQLVTPVHSTET